MLELVKANMSKKHPVAEAGASVTGAPKEISFASVALSAFGSSGSPPSSKSAVGGGGGLAAGLVAKAAARLKAKAAKSTKSETFLRMQPTDDDHPPIGLPVREMLVQTFNYKRDRTMFDFMMYFVYVAVFIAVVYQLNDTQLTENANGNIYDAFLDESMVDDANGNQVTFKKTFFDIGDLPELQQWLVTVFVPVFYQLMGPISNPPMPYLNQPPSLPSWYNGDPFDSSMLGTVRREMRVVQGARIWLARVTNTSCSPEQKTAAYLQSFAPPDRACYGDYDVDTTNVAMTPFGPPNDPQRYKYYSPMASTVQGLTGYSYVSDYGSGGYIVYLPTDAANGSSIVYQLLKDRFFDKSTRMVTIDFNIYNADTGYLTASRFTLEMLKTGNILKSYRLYSIKMLLYETATDYIRAAGEIFVLLFTIYYLGREVQRLRASKPWYKYFINWANFFDISLQILMLICVAFWLLQVTNPVRRNFSVNSPCLGTAKATPNAAGANTCYVDMFTVARSFQYAVTTAGVLGLLFVLKFFKYFSLSRRMNALWLTLSHSSSSLAGFSVGFAIVVAGFSFFAQQAFGSLVADFHTFPASFSTLMRYPLGDFDYFILAQARPDVAPYFFFLYVILVFLVAMNMVIAIITAAFEDVSRGLKAEEKWKHVTTPYALHLMKKSRFYILSIFILFRLLLGERIASLLCCCGYCISRKTTFSAPPVDARNGPDGSPAMPVKQERSSMRINPIHAAGSTALDKDANDLERDAIAAENVFVRFMRRFVTMSEKESRSDLCAYFEEIYKTTPEGKNVYVGLNELCALCRNPDVPLDPFCKVGHRWKSLGAFVIAKAAQAQARSASSARRGFLCFGGKKGRGNLASAMSDMDSAASAETKSAWTHNPLMDDDDAGSGAAGMDVESIKAKYTPTCVAWNMVNAYNNYKDVILLGPSERHPFMNDANFNDDDDPDAEVDDATAGRTGNMLSRQPGVKGSWQITKLNRSDTRQRRYISVKDEGTNSVSKLVIYNHDLKGTMKRRFLAARVMQVDASIPNPRRCFMYITADESISGGDPLARFAIMADTIYDMIFVSADERDDFINLLVKIREAGMGAGSRIVDKDAKKREAAFMRQAATKERSPGGILKAVQNAAMAEAAGIPAAEIAAGSKIAMIARRKMDAKRAAASGAKETPENGVSTLTFRRQTVVPNVMGAGFLDGLISKKREARASKFHSAPPLSMVAVDGADADEESLN